MDEFLYIFQTFGYLFVIVASVFALIANALVNSTFKRYSAQFTRRGLTGAEAAQRVLTDNGVTGVRIAQTQGKLTDHYDPRDNTIYLSESVYGAASTAAIGVAAHEAGHAVQHAQGYFPIRLRNAIVPVTNFGSRLSIPLILIGLALSAYAGTDFGYNIALVGVFLYSFCVLFQLVTLPTEFNASRRAIRAIETGGILDPEEVSGAKKTLTAAAMTYVAALAVSVLQFLRLLAIILGGRRRK